MESEELLENVLVQNPELLIEGMTLVGRQTPTEGGPLDLLGVDEDGRLCVFELKRGTLSRDSVAQIIDYASYLDGMDVIHLATHISECSGALGIDEIEDFEEWYGGRHGALESLKPLRLFLVGLGVDDRTERMVRFLAENSSMEISLLTFHGFVFDGKTFLAKQVEVTASQEKGDQRSRRNLSASEKRSLLENRVEEFGVRDLFTGIRNTFRENWHGYNENIGNTAIGIRMPVYIDSRRRQRAFGRIDPEIGKVRVVFYQSVANLCRSKFRPLVKRLGCKTWPINLDPITDTSAEVQFVFSAETWKNQRQTLTELLHEIHNAYLRDCISESGVDDLFDETLELFHESWPDCVNVLHRLGIDVTARTGSELTPLARIAPSDESVGAVFYPTSANLCRDKFRALTEKVRYTTWPHNLEPLTDARAEIQFAFNRDEWEIHKETLTELLRSVYSAWQESRETAGGA